MDYLGIFDLNNIVDQYLIGENKISDIMYDRNLNANLYGADLYIARPLLFQLCHGGHILLVKKYIDYCIFDNKHSNDLNNGFKNACNCGHLEIVKYLIDKGANHLNIGLLEACEYGHLEIVKYLIDKGANNFNRGIREARENGHFKIVQFLIEYIKNQHADLNNIAD